ncbi:MAG: hypothetical protein IKD30_01740, partial [Peptococcaceae bacterium]|nr:hypothetical protein [Peptococcaceae bacterium]
YPFCVLYFTFQGESLDVNVHPTKMELRFDNNQEVYQYLCDGLHKTFCNFCSLLHRAHYLPYYLTYYLPMILFFLCKCTKKGLLPDD